MHTCICFTFLLIQEIQVEFEAQTPVDSDFNGIRTLLQQVGDNFIKDMQANIYKHCLNWLSANQ